MTTDISKLSLETFYPSNIQITDIHNYEHEIVIDMHSITKECICSKCGAVLTKHHGTHHRTVQDLPILGKRVTLNMQIYDYQCNSNSCVSFACSETFNGFLTHNSRMTERLLKFICMLAVETSCEACARIMQSLHVKISGDTVIRMLLKCHPQKKSPVCSHSIGIDDFAYKKRHTYVCL